MSLSSILRVKMTNLQPSVAESRNSFPFTSISTDIHFGKESLYWSDFTKQIYGT